MLQRVRRCEEDGGEQAHAAPGRSWSRRVRTPVRTSFWCNSQRNFKNIASNLHFSDFSAKMHKHIPYLQSLIKSDKCMGKNETVSGLPQMDAKRTVANGLISKRNLAQKKEERHNSTKHFHRNSMEHITFCTRCGLEVFSLRFLRAFAYDSLEY